MNDEPDVLIRQAAFAEVRRLSAMRVDLTAEDLRTGFEVNGQRVPWANLRRGIFKPRSMRHLLSIRTVFPKLGAKVWYDDQRLVHQQIYGGEDVVDYGRCAITGLPEARLLDAAHIIADAHEILGQPVIPNGLPLSKIHHAAFDSHLIGVDPDFRVHVSRSLLDQDDGPMLELLKRTHGERLHLPARTGDLPDRDRLAERFDLFRSFE